MNYKYIMKQSVLAQLPAWVVLELWEILIQIERRNITEYSKEDIQELLLILEQKVDSIQHTAIYQKAHFGKSKYDL